MSVTSRDSSKYKASLATEGIIVTGINFEPIDQSFDGIAVLDYEITDGQFKSKGVINLLVGGISIGTQSNPIIERGTLVAGLDKTSIEITLSEG